MFRNRRDAAEQLVQVIDDRDLEDKVDLVVAVPRGGVPIGRIVADELGVPLDIVAAKKLGAPGNAELAIGAVAADGSLWRNEPLIGRLGVPETYVDEERERVAELAREKAEHYRVDGPETVAGKHVMVVDDGVATGATMFACVESLENADAASVTVAVPVAPPNTVEQLRRVADDVVVVSSPPHFAAVGQFYDHFEQVSDDEAIAMLHGERRGAPGA
ncbi:phosphoribosyltransferase [Haloarchaeobius sp. HME9146]|uniref:phosphoribosyltransferase n=1 Tax=Haloarchaeobius sp. HME9146 TaxID=2978732 RepID=UPI0021C07257|nr:phosphoribosyltransferase family protein [Haloarchaeobius sp. HME9146]MCT9094756.1 phosphoribosyltransferase family protein [Haloarchaeobius sp. HME9146]